MGHAEGKWICVFTSNKSRAVRNKGGLIASIYKPNRYSGQDERYDKELEEARCNQKLIASSPVMYERLSEILDNLDSGKWVLDELEEPDDKTVDEWIEEAEMLINPKS